MAEHYAVGVAHRRVDGDAVRQQAPKIRLTVQRVGIADLRQHGGRDAEHAAQLVVPTLGVYVEKLGAAGVGGIGLVDGAVGHLPHRPCVHRAEAQPALTGFFRRAGDVLQNPAHLGGGEEGGELQAGLFLYGLPQPGAVQPVTEGGGTVALPHHGVGNRLAGVRVPNADALPLVGHGDAYDVAGGGAGVLDHHAADAGEISSDLQRVVADPTLVVDELAVGDVPAQQKAPLFVQQQRLCTLRALIHGQDIRFAHVCTSCVVRGKKVSPLRKDPARRA